MRYSNFCWNYYYLPISYLYPYMEFHSQLYDRNQQYLFSYAPQMSYPLTYFRQGEDIITIPDSAKTKKVFPIGEEFFIPEFKISQCNIDRISEYLQYDRGFKISMNKVKQEFKSAESGVKELAKKFNEELNGLIGNNSAEIKRIEEQIKEKYANLHALDCSLRAVNICLKISQEIKDLEKKIKGLKSKGSFLSSLDIARNKFHNSLDKLKQNQIQNVNWPKSWPNLEDIEYMPVIVNRYLDIPKTLKDMNIDSSLIQNIPISEDIMKALKFPLDMFGDIELSSIKNQIQFDDLIYSPQQVLIDLASGAISELQKYNMCFYMKNSPYSLEIQLEYVSDFKRLVEYYIYGCLEKAKQAALLVFGGYIPTIISSYGASIPMAISNAFATYWATFKKCLFDIYHAFKEEIKKMNNIKSFEGFLKIIEKYISIDFTLEKRTVPWEQRDSLINLLSNRIMYINTRQVPFAIDPKEEYVQSDPQFSYYATDVTLSEESLKKLITNCGRLGMWIFVTLKDVDSYRGKKHFWLNVRRFENNILSGYSIRRSDNGEKIKENIDIPIQNIQNLQCYDIDPYDNPKDLLVSNSSEDFCTDNKGRFFGKDYIDMNKGILIYYEVYECGVYTRIYVNEVFKSELYILRYKENIKHAYKYNTSLTTSNTIVLEITKAESELQNRLHITINENESSDPINTMVWKIKLPW